MITKHSQTTYVVMKPNVALPTTPNTLYDFATDNLNLNIGVAGLYAPVAGSGNYNLIDPADTIHSFKVVQRRNKLGDRSPLYNKTFIESEWVNPFCLNGLNISARAATESPVLNNLWLVGDVLGGPNQIPVTEEITYKFQVSAHGDRTDLYNGVYNTPTQFGYYESPDWTALSFTPAQELDITIESLVEDYNNNSQNFSFAFCIESAGTSAAATGVFTLESLAGQGGTPVNVGDSVVIGYKSCGTPVNIVMSQEWQNTFAELFAAVPTGTMKPYLLPNTPNAPAAGVVPTAGTTSTVDHFAIMSVDASQGYYDYRINTKRRLTVGLAEGFEGQIATQVVVQNEGANTGRQVGLQYRMHNMYEETGRPRPEMSYSVEFPNEVLEDASYDLFVIEHCDNRTSTGGFPALNNMTTIIAVVSYEDPTTPYFELAGVGNPNPQKTYVQDVLNKFIADNGLNITPLSI